MKWSFIAIFAFLAAASYFVTVFCDTQSTDIVVVESEEVRSDATIGYPFEMLRLRCKMSHALGGALSEIISSSTASKLNLPGLLLNTLCFLLFCAALTISAIEYGRFSSPLPWLPSLFGIFAYVAIESRRWTTEYVGDSVSLIYSIEILAGWYGTRVLQLSTLFICVGISLWISRLLSANATERT